MGDVSCAQYSTSLETWNADFRDKSMEIATLKIDNKDLTHDTWFPTKDITKGTVTHQTSVTNYPVGTVERGKPENLSISTYWVPDIKEWLTGGAVIRNNVNFVKNENGSYIFESPEMPVKESLLRGIDTSGKVTVKIMYGLIRREK